ncbi:hypothetical protein V1511DRAFT_486969 [Dipodascopsis uninucleata]
MKLHCSYRGTGELGGLRNHLILSVILSLLVFIAHTAAAAETSSKMPLDQILETKSVPPHVVSIFTRYFPSSLMTDYSAVDKQLSQLMASNFISTAGGTVQTTAILSAPQVSITANERLQDLPGYPAAVITADPSRIASSYTSAAEPSSLSVTALTSTPTILTSN